MPSRRDEVSRRDHCRSGPGPSPPSLSRAGAPRSGDRERERGRSSSRAGVRPARAGRPVREGRPSVRSLAPRLEPGSRRAPNRASNRRGSIARLWTAPTRRHALPNQRVPVPARPSAGCRPNVLEIRLHPTGRCPSHESRHLLWRRGRARSMGRPASCDRRPDVLPVALQERDGSLGRVQRASEECTWAGSSRCPGRSVSSSTSTAKIEAPTRPSPDGAGPSMRARSTAVTARSTATGTATDRLSADAVGDTSGDRALPEAPTVMLGSIPGAKTPKNDKIPWSRSSKGIQSMRNPGGDLLSQGASPQVPSARAGLTAVFGMGTGVSPPLWPPETVRSASPTASSPRRRTERDHACGCVTAAPERSKASTSRIEPPSPRPISTGRLNALLHLHLRPINVVV